MTGTCAACAPLYARRRGVLIDALARHAPGVRLTGLAAGFHAVAHLPETAASRRSSRPRARAFGRPVRDERVPVRASRDGAPPQLVLGFGNVSERAIEAGIAAVADLLR